MPGARSDSNDGSHARLSSPLPGRSSLMTSAPKSASSWAAHGPASTRAMSSTRTPASYEVPPPLLGEHTGEVLSTVLGLGPDELAALRDQGVV